MLYAINGSDRIAKAKSWVNLPICRFKLLSTGIDDTYLDGCVVKHVKSSIDLTFYVNLGEGL